MGQDWLEENSARDENVLTVTKLLLLPSTRGNDELISKMIVTMHPAYSTHPVVSKLELLKLLGYKV